MKNLPNFVKGLLSCFAVIAGLFILLAFMPPSKSGQLAKQRAAEALLVDAPQDDYAQMSPTEKYNFQKHVLQNLVANDMEANDTWTPPTNEQAYIDMLTFILDNSIYVVDDKMLMIYDTRLNEEFYFQYDAEIILDDDKKTYHLKRR